MFKKIAFLSLFLFLFGCKEQNKPLEQQHKIPFSYAKHIEMYEDEATITIVSNGNQTTFHKKDLPLTNIMVETTAAITFLNELNELSIIKGVVDPDYIYNPEIRKKIANNEILKIGTINELYAEIILKEKPQLIITNTNPTLAKFHQQLEENGIKVLYIDEYKENDPLGRLEYVKIFGKLMQKEELANQQVEKTARKYDSIKSIIQNKAKNPIKTIVNTMYGDVWYLPSGSVLQAKLIDDAKGNYVYNAKTGEQSLNLNFEQVYADAKEATHWLNPSFSSLEEMKANYPNYAWIKAFKEENVYNSNKRMLESGAQDYFEQGIVRPDLILNDLGKIFHPELFPNYELYFYQQLK